MSASHRSSTAPLQPSPWWTNTIDLNTAPHPEVHLSAPTGERPSGHHVANYHRDAGGGILEDPPPHPVTGTSSEPPHVHFGSSDDTREEMGHRAPLSKIEFPMFDGVNPRLWRDRCDMYFEVYSVKPALKTRFATLNFKGVAASWLQMLEQRGGFQIGSSSAPRFSLASIRTGTKFIFDI